MPNKDVSEKITTARYYRCGPREQPEVRTKGPQKTIMVCYHLGRTFPVTTITSEEQGYSILSGDVLKGLQQTLSYLNQ